MTWFKVDDQFPNHRKVIAIPRRNRFTAIGAWVSAGCWSASQLSDGHVPAYALRELGIPSGAMDSLLAVGLWEPDGAGGIQFCDWSSWQPTRAQIEDNRRKTRRRVEVFREKTRLRLVE